MIVKVTSPIQKEYRNISFSYTKNFDTDPDSVDTDSATEIEFPDQFLLSIIRTSDIKIEIYLDCCPNIPVFKGIAKKNKYKICKKDCKLTLYFYDLFTFDCLNKTLIGAGENDPFNSRPHRIVRQCTFTSPTILTHLLIGITTILFSWVNVMILMFLPILIIIGIIITIVNAAAQLLGLDEIDDALPDNGVLSIFQTLLDLQADVGEWLTGCGSGFVAVLINDYIDDICRQCAIIHDPASPFKNALKDIALITPVATEPDHITADSIRQNFRVFGFLNERGDQFLFWIRKFFRLYGVLEDDGVLRFYNGVPTAIIQIPEPKVLNFCYDNSRKPIVAVNYEYLVDTLDLNASKRGVLRYEEIHELIPNGSGSIKTITLPAAPTMFRNDNSQSDILAFWERNTPLNILYGLSTPVLAMESRNPQYRRYIVTSTGTIGEKRVVDLDVNTPVTHTLVKSFYRGGSGVNAAHWYNQEMTVDNGIAGLYYKPNTPSKLWELWKTYNPNSEKATLTVAVNCQWLQLIIKKPFVGIKYDNKTWELASATVNDGEMVLELINPDNFY